MEDVTHEGRTVLFVSHNMGAITRLCSRALWIDKGVIYEEGSSNEIVNLYQSQYLTGRAQWNRTENDTANRDFSFIKIRVLNTDGQLCSFFDGNWPVVIEILYKVTRQLSGCQIGIRVINSEGTVIFTTADSDQKGVSALSKAPGDYRTSLVIPRGLLSSDKYYLLVAAHQPFRHTYEVIEQPVVFEISQSNLLSSLDGRTGVITPLINWETSKAPIS